MRYPTRSRLFGRVSPFRLLRLAGAGVIAAFLWAMADPVAAAALSTRAVQLNAPIANCHAIARAALESLKFTAVEVRTSEVVGTSGGVYVSVQCFETTPKPTAFVMGVADIDFNAVQKVVADLADAILRQP
jgi:hypothetical protein